MIHFITSNNHPSNPQQPIHSLRLAPVQCEAPKIAKLVHNSNFTMVYGTSNELVTGANLNQRSHHNGGPHIVRIFHLHLQNLSPQDPVNVKGQTIPIDSDPGDGVNSNLNVQRMKMTHKAPIP